MAIASVVAGCGQVNQEPPQQPDAGEVIDVDAAVTESIDAGPRVARSLDDFAKQQGARGWHYLYREPGKELKELAYDGDGAWASDAERRWTKIWASGMHPDVAG